MDNAIILENINKKLGNREVLRNVSFTVEKGDVFGFLGPNGAGKTTTIRIALGLLRPSSGKVSVLGQDINLEATRKRVGFLLEADGLFDNLSARENMGYYASIYGVEEPARAIRNCLEIAGLQSRASDKVAAYSKGMRQRLALARALVHDPELLILDEPTSGIDPSGQIEIRRLILERARVEGKTIFLSSHNLDEVHRVCNRIAVIDHGEIKLYGDTEQLQRKLGSGKTVVETARSIPRAVLEELSLIPGFFVENETERALTFTLRNGTTASDVIRFLMDRGVVIEQVRNVEASLEEIYTTILEGKDNEKYLARC
jgi:ABC-2 type transport system ATP-binding protein